MSDRTSHVLAGLAIGGFVVFLFALIVAAREEVKHGGCAEYERTGAMTCWGDESWKHCEPDKRCVRYNDGVVPGMAAGPSKTAPSSEVPETNPEPAKAGGAP